MVATSKNIKVTEKTKKEIDELKTHPRETYEDIIVRLIEKCKI